MRKGFILTAALAVVAIAAVSCAKSAPPVIGEKESLETFNRWMAKYAPDADSIANGVYLEFLSRASDVDLLPAPVLDSSWLYLNLTGRNLEGSVFGTRDSSLSKLIGTWSYTTHFVPQLLSYSKRNTAICPGLLTALKHFRVGDKAKVYLWSKLTSSTSTFTAGYVNSSVEYQGYPISYQVELVDMTNKPVEWEEKLVNEYAATHWGYGIKDTIAKGMYMHTLVSKPKGYPITLDSTVYLRKALYFSDNQLLSTNIDSIAKARHYYGVTGQTESQYLVQVITPSIFNNDYSLSNQIYRKVLPLMRVGEKAEIIATSRWGFGPAGKVTNVPQLGSYEPLLYYFHVEPKAKK